MSARVRTWFPEQAKPPWAAPARAPAPAQKAASKKAAEPDEALLGRRVRVWLVAPAGDQGGRELVGTIQRVSRYVVVLEVAGRRLALYKHAVCLLEDLSGH